MRRFALFQHALKRCAGGQMVCAFCVAAFGSDAGGEGREGGRNMKHPTRKRGVSHCGRLLGSARVLLFSHQHSSRLSGEKECALK